MLDIDFSDEFFGVLASQLFNKFLTPNASANPKRIVIIPHKILSHQEILVYFTLFELFYPDLLRGLYQGFCRPKFSYNKPFLFVQIIVLIIILEHFMPLADQDLGLTFQAFSLRLWYRSEMSKLVFTLEVLDFVMTSYYCVFWRQSQLIH